MHSKQNKDLNENEKNTRRTERKVLNNKNEQKYKLLLICPQYLQLFIHTFEQVYYRKS